KAAETVVGTKFENENIDRLAKEPIDAAETPSAGFAADSGVDGAEIPAESIEFLLEQSGVSFIRIDSVTGGEAVAEEDDGFRRRFFRGLGGEKGSGEEERESEGEEAGEERKVENRHGLRSGGAV